MTKWTTSTWKKFLLWIAGYVNVLALVLIGGYVVLKEDDKEVKKTAKTVCLVYVLFTAISAFLSIYAQVGNMFDGWYNSTAYEVYGILNSLVNIARIIVFAICALVAVFKADDTEQKAVAEKTEEKQEEKVEDRTEE